MYFILFYLLSFKRLEKEPVLGVKLDFSRNTNENGSVSYRIITKVRTFKHVKKWSWGPITDSNHRGTVLSLILYSKCSWVGC